MHLLACWEAGTLLTEAEDCWREPQKQLKGKLPCEEEMARAQMEREYRQHKVVTYNKVTEFKARPGPLVFSLLFSSTHTHHTHTRAHTRQLTGIRVIPFLWADIKITVPWPRQPTERAHCRLRYFPTLLPQGQEDSVARAHTQTDRIHKEHYKRKAFLHSTGCTCAEIYLCLRTCTWTVHTSELKLWHARVPICTGEWASRRLPFCLIGKCQQKPMCQWRVQMPVMIS